MGLTSPEGILATKPGEQPKRPDAYLLRDVSTILLDCGLRSEECPRLKWENIRDGAVEIFTGKRKASRRRIPASARVLSMRYVHLNDEDARAATEKAQGGHNANGAGGGI